MFNPSIVELPSPDSASSLLFLPLPFFVVAVALACV
jgi:hypothetical protein